MASQACHDAQTVEMMWTSDGDHHIPTPARFIPQINRTILNPRRAARRGAGLVAAATLAGAWLARRRPRQRQTWFAAAAGALLIITGLHILPDSWAGARDAHIWPGLVPLAAAATFAAAGLAARAGCGCQEHQEQASGTGTAATLAVHRFLEGSAIALAGSAAVALALAAHAFGEGLATGALLGSQPRRRVAVWLALMCFSPVIGAAAADAFPVPAAAEPVLLAMAAGILAQAARISLRAAFRGLRPTRLLLSRPAATTTTAAIVTALAVHGLS
jgi:zinc transporter ZupT